MLVTPGPALHRCYVTVLPERPLGSRAVPSMEMGRFMVHRDLLGSRVLPSMQTGRFVWSLWSTQLLFQLSPLLSPSDIFSTDSRQHTILADVGECVVGTADGWDDK